MKKAIAPPAILAVATAPHLSVISGKQSATVINQKPQFFGGVSKIISINKSTGVTIIKEQEAVISTEPEWYNHYE